MHHVGREPEHFPLNALQKVDLGSGAGEYHRVRLLSVHVRRDGGASTTIDRYTKALLTLIGAALTMIALNLWVGPQRWLEPRAAEAQPGRHITAPKAWGKAVGFIAGHVYLEAENGTIRLVNIGGTTGPIGGVVLEITRN